MSSLIRKLAVVAGIGLALGSVVHVPTASAREVVVEEVRVAPPPPRFERVPPPRAGWIWAPGYWAWRGPGAGHVWVSGHWEHVRPGWRYHQAEWIRTGGGWRFREGYWVR